MTIFIDGSNLFWACKSISFKIDMEKLVNRLAEGRPLGRPRYYGSISEEPTKKQLAFCRVLKYLGFEVVLKTLKKRQDLAGNVWFIEKGVDVALALDMLSMAYENAYDVAILVSGDGDYVAAVERIKKGKGKRVEVAFFEQLVSPELKMISDRFISLDKIKDEIGRIPAIEVPEVLRERLSTGYEDLDKLLLGGIPRQYPVMLTSPTCDERDLLIKRFLETGAKNGEVTFYITADPGELKTLAEEFPSNFYLVICNPQAYRMIKKMSNVSELKGVEDLSGISMALTSAFRRLDASLKGPRRICIEIIPDVLLQHQAVQTRRWLTQLIPELKWNEFTTLAMLDPEMHSRQEVLAILDLFEGEISIYDKVTEKGLKKFLKIRRMYNQKYLESELPLQKEKLQ